jgi:hypothetical protein
MLDYPALLHPLLIPVMSSIIPIHAVHNSDRYQKVVGMHRIQWSACSGFGGRHVPDSLADMRRITHSPQKVVAVSLF